MHGPKIVSRNTVRICRLSNHTAPRFKPGTGRDTDHQTTTPHFCTCSPHMRVQVNVSEPLSTVCNSTYLGWDNFDRNKEQKKIIETDRQQVVTVKKPTVIMWIFGYIAEPVTAELDAKEYITYRCICSKRRRLGLLYRVHICGDSDYFWDSVYPVLKKRVFP